jgi:hypothetical protein
MTSSTMSRRRLAVPPLALALLLLVAGSLLSGQTAAQHHHDRVGLYNPDCPLVALATVDRQGGVLVAATSAPLVSATGRVVGTLVDDQAAPPAADVRFRAPPTR